MVEVNRGSVCRFVSVCLTLCRLLRGQLRILSEQHCLDSSPTSSAATCSTGSHRVHDVKSVVAQSFDARYQCWDRYRHTLQGCIGNVLGCHSMSQLHEQCRGYMHVPLKFGQRPKLTCFSFSQTRRRPSASECAQPPWWCDFLTSMAV